MLFTFYSYLCLGPLVEHLAAWWKIADLFSSYYADREELEVCVSAVGIEMHQRNGIRIKEMRSYRKISPSQTREYISHMVTLATFFSFNINYAV